MSTKNVNKNVIKHKAIHKQTTQSYEIGITDICTHHHSCSNVMLKRKRILFYTDRFVLLTRERFGKRLNCSNYAKKRTFTTLRYVTCG